MDVAPKQKTTPRQRVAQLVRLLGTPVRDERANTWRRLEPAMQAASMNWTDIGNAVEEGKYTETEMQEFAQASRAEGVEAGIKIGLARASDSNGNGHLTLPKPDEMAEYCHERLSQMKDDKQRDFINDMYRLTQFRQRGGNLSLGRLGYLASIYIQIGGKV